MRVLPALASEIVRMEPPAPAVLHKLEAHLLDTVGLTLLGLGTSEARETLSVFRLGFGEPCSEVGAGLAAQLAMACRLTESDDIHIGSSVTPGSVVIPALLCAGPEGGDDTRWLNAILAGYHIFARIGAASDGARAVYRGDWPTCFAAPMAISGALAVNWGLPEPGIAAALSIAATMAFRQAGRIPLDPTSRWITLGAGVQCGFLAALAARSGLQADLDLPEPWAVHEDEPNPRSPHDAFAHTELKPFHGSRQSMSAIVAFMSAIERHRIDPASIQAVRVRVPTEYARMIDRPVPPRSKSESRGVQHQIAMSAFSPDYLFDLERSAPIEDRRVLRLSGCVEVVADESLSLLYPSLWPAVVEIRASGTDYRLEMNDPSGDGLFPSTIDDVGGKLERMIRAAGKPYPLERLGNAITSGDFSALLPMLRAEIGNGRRPGR